MMQKSKQTYEVHSVMAKSEVPKMGEINEKQDDKDSIKLLNPLNDASSQRIS